jgi:hypothetical protein
MTVIDSIAWPTGSDNLLSTLTYPSNCDHFCNRHAHKQPEKTKQNQNFRKSANPQWTKEEALLTALSSSCKKRYEMNSRCFGPRVRVGSIPTSGIQKDRSVSFGQLFSKLAFFSSRYKKGGVSCPYNDAVLTRSYGTISIHALR